MKNNVFLLGLIFFLFTKCGKKSESNETESKVDKDFKLLNEYKHSTDAFTEGLFFDGNVLYESTGAPDDLKNTQSEFGILNLQNGKIDVKYRLDKSKYFGEGIAMCSNKIFQLTYKNQIGFVYDAKNYKMIDRFRYDNLEGWGLTNFDDNTLIMSDGTDKITFIDIKNFKVLKKISVLLDGNPVLNLNELEYVDGFIYSNIYNTNYIVKIDCNTGLVHKSFDLSELYFDAKEKNPLSLEMNGIAYNKASNTFYITGKMWSSVYQLKFNE